VSDEDDFTSLTWVRAQHSNIREIAPPSERVLEVLCGSRVVAAVWPKWGAETFAVTVDGPTRLDSASRTVVAGCACKRRQHVLDLGKIQVLVDELDRPANKRPPSVTVRRVEKAHPR